MITLERAAPPAGPADPTFDAWASTQLVWLPERGMGRLCVTEAPYDDGYFEKYRRYAATPMGRAITAARVDLVRRFTDRHVVDIGIGCGAFVSARGGWTWGYDVNPAGIAWLRAQGRWADPYTEPVESLSFWDTLEHIPEPAVLLARVRHLVFASLPIVPEGGPPAPDWKHLRRDEHCWYWTDAGFRSWMGAQGFRCLEANGMETVLGRSDIGTYVFQRER